MKDFRFYCPVELIFGDGALNRLPKYISPAKRVMVVTGTTWARKSGLLDRVIGLLKKALVEHISAASAEPNPSIATVEKAAERARRQRIELVIGLGGGSAMDAAKAIAVCATNSRPLRELFPIHDFPEKPLPIICIPTTAGTGSEMAPYAIITDEKVNDKFNLNSPATFPKISLLDPQLTVSMPPSITADTGIDALCHAIEGYLAKRSQPISDFIALEAIRTVKESLPKVFISPDNLEARGRMLYAAALAGIVIAHTGTVALHAFGYHLTLKYGQSHGRANATLLPHFLKSIEQTVPEKINKIYAIFEDGGQKRGVEAIFDFVHQLGVSTKLCDYGLTPEDIPTYRDYVVPRGNTRNTPGDYGADQIEKLLLNALE